MQFFISEIAHKIIGNIRIAAVDEKYKKEGEIDYAEFCTVYPRRKLYLEKPHRRKLESWSVNFGITKVFLVYGGGSAIDTAKGIAIGAANPGTDIWEFWKKIMML